MKRVLIAFAVGTAVIFAAAAPSSALPPAATGWWWKLQTSGSIPPPPTVPGGGLMVGADPSGASAIAALRYELEPTDANPVLTLTVAKNGDINGAAGVLGACRSGSAWTSTYAGRWDAKPTAVCTKSVTAIRSADGTTYTLALAPLLVGTVLDVVLVPQAGSATFSLAFNAPTTSSLKTTTVAAAPETSSFTPDVAPVDVPSADVAPVDALATPAPAAFTPALPAADQVLTHTAPAVQAATASNVPTAGSATNERSAIAFVLLLVAGVATWSLGRVPTPARRALGPMTGTAVPAAVRVEPETGGLGRFARPRRGSAPPIR